MNPPPKVPAQTADRLHARRRLLSDGTDPYPPARPVHDDLAEIHARHAGLDPDTATGRAVVVAGRVVAQRTTKTTCFVTLRDGAAEIQLLLAVDTGGPAGSHARWRETVDLADHVVVEGEVVTSRRGTLSVRVTRWDIAGKALRPLPGRPRHHDGPPQPGLPAAAGPRHRYQRMMLDPGEVVRLRGRAAVLRALREVLHAEGFVEADTPLLQPVPSVTARSFETWMNAWRKPLYLRITAEVYLKRLVVGGLNRVFEINRVFRNEGVDATHFPEFMACEGYAAHTDYLRSAQTAERLVRAAAEALRAVEPGAARCVGAAPFPRRTFHEVVSQAVGEPVTVHTSRADLARHARDHGLAVAPEATASALAVLLYRKVAEPRLREATFVFDFPVQSAIFARACRTDPELVEAWTLAAAGLDIGQGCTELTDPVEQRARLDRQAAAMPGADGSAPPPPLDEGFLTALEHGMPPLGGFNLGVDRLMTALRDDGGRLRDHQCHPIERARD